MKNDLVSIEWLHHHWNDPNLVILDASLNSNKSHLTTQYPHQQLPNSRFFDLKNTFSDQKSTIPNTILSPDVFAENCQQLGIDNNSKIVVYDNLGIYSSPRVWWLFKAMGHQAVAVLNGGLPAWINAGFPTEQKGNTPFQKGDFEANYQAHLIVDFKHVLKNIDRQDAVVIDARSTDRFLGQRPEPRKNLRAGHIPNSLSLPFKNLLHNGHLKTKEALLPILEALPLHNRPLITSCGSGTTACILLLAFSVTEFNNSLSLYDGSWSEWGTMPTLPIA